MVGFGVPVFLIKALTVDVVVLVDVRVRIVPLCEVVVLSAVLVIQHTEALFSVQGTACFVVITVTLVSLQEVRVVLVVFQPITDGLLLSIVVPGASLRRLLISTPVFVILLIFKITRGVRRLTEDQPVICLTFDLV